MSASIITTGPRLGQVIAMFTAVVVFPSPGRLEVTSRDFGARPAVESSMEVRNWR